MIEAWHTIVFGVSHLICAEHAIVFGAFVAILVLSGALIARSAAVITVSAAVITVSAP